MNRRVNLLLLLVIPAVFSTKTIVSAKIHDATLNESDCNFIDTYLGGPEEFIGDFLDRIHSDHSNSSSEYPNRDINIPLIRFIEPVYIGILIDRELQLYDEIVEETDFWLELVGAESLLGYRLEQPVGQPLFTLLVGDVRSQDRSVIEDLFPTNRFVEEYLRVDDSVCMVTIDTNPDNSIATSSVIIDSQFGGERVMECIGPTLINAFGLSSFPESSPTSDFERSEIQSTLSTRSSEELTQRERISVRLLYNQDMVAGSDFETTRAVLTSIINRDCSAY